MSQRYYRYTVYCIVIAVMGGVPVIRTGRYYIGVDPFGFRKITKNPLIFSHLLARYVHEKDFFELSLLLVQFFQL